MAINITDRMRRCVCIEPLDDGSIEFTEEWNGNVQTVSLNAKEVKTLLAVMHWTEEDGSANAK